MRPRRLLAVFPALAAAFFTAAGALAVPTITPATLQCDGVTYTPGGNTHSPNPSIQVTVQDGTGLRVGQAGMGITGTGFTRELWRFDSGVTTSLSCSASGACAGGACLDYTYTYADPDNSDNMIVGNCVYNGSTNNCGTAVATSSNTAQSMNPLGQTSCPTSPPAASVTIFTAGAASSYPNGGFGDAASFDGSTQFGSVTYSNNGQGNRAATYTLSAWIKSTNTGANQRILSEQGPAGFWGFGLAANGGVRLFDSRNGANTDVTVGSGYDDGNWHKIDAMRVNGFEERFYVDGNFIGFVAATSTDTFANHPIAHPLMIGRYEAGGEYFKGQIDEIRVMDTSLTDEEIYLEYNGSNLHQYADPNTAAYSHVAGGFPVGVTNGDTSSAIYSPGEAITAASFSNQRWIFEAQNIETVTTLTTTFTVTMDQTAPTAPQSLAGTPTGTNSMSWSWTAPTHYCQPPGSASVYYQAYDAETGALLNPPGDIAYPALSYSETVPGGANQILSRRLNMTDHWGTSPLAASASAYTMAAVPTPLTASNVSTGGFVATWTPDGNPSYTRYELTYTTDPNFVVGVATRVGIGDDFTGTSINVTGLPAGVTYYARVRAFNGQASDFYGGVPSGFATLSVVTSPPAPAIAGVPLSNSAIRWNWAAASGATGYTLYDTPTQAVLFGPDGDGLSFISATLSVNTRYEAEVEADLPAPSPPSTRGSAYAYTLANVPTATAVSAVYPTSATFSWNANGNPSYTFYQVIVATDPTFDVVTATLTVSSPTATATGLLPGATYYSKVEAINGGQLETGYVAIPQTATATDPEITVSSSPPSPYVATTGLAGAWQFDEDTGTVSADGSGNGNTANLWCGIPCTLTPVSSTPTWAAGPPGMGSAVSFNGEWGGVVVTNAGLNIPGGGGNGGSVTVEAWVNPNINQNAGAGIVSAGRQTFEDFALDISAGQDFEFLTSNGGGTEYHTTAPSSFVPGQWTHVVGVYDQAHSTSTLYVNGLPVAVSLAVPARPNLAPPLAIGNREDGVHVSSFTLPFAGRIDSVRVIASALTASQVMADYLGGFISSVTAPAPNEGIVLALPPNAFGAPAQIFISADPVNHPIKISPAALNAGLAVTPSGLTLVPNSLVEVVPVVGGLPFTTPLGSSATLTIPYKDPGNTGVISGTNPPLAAAGLQMYTLNTAVNAWFPLPTTVDKVNHAVNGVTPHFSVFALFAPETIGTSLAGVRAYPVPWKPGTGGRFDAPGVTFANLPASGTIRILTLAGRRVRDFSFNGVSAGTAVWDGLNDDGRRTASGVYFARVTSGVDGSTLLIKFAVER